MSNLMKRYEEDRVGAFAACPFCGERRRLKFISRLLRRGDGDWPHGGYVYCPTCKARGPLVVAPATIMDEAAADAWNGGLQEPKATELLLFKEETK